MKQIAQIHLLAKQLSLSNLANHPFELFPEQISNEDFLIRCLKDEIAYREQKAKERRIKQAQIPAVKTFESFDTGFQNGITDWQLRQLAALNWIDGMTMQSVVREINAEYDDRLEETKNATSHDVLEMSGSRAVWKEVLAVYSVKTTTDPDNPQEVATMDESKKKLLTNIFWEMNEISSRTEAKTETVITESDDGNGNIVETESTVTQTYLYITVSHKTAEEMADIYGFNEQQRQQLAELLAEENNLLWSQVLYGIAYGDGEIVSVALSQLGNVGGEPYWSWYGFEGRVEWCACFVSWCANECGYIEAGIIPKFAGCVLGSQWFMDREQWQGSDFEPSAGHIIFFDWESDGETDHVGIVEKCENGIVYTIEGNSGDACKQKQYAVGSSIIYGYGIPAY